MPSADVLVEGTTPPTYGLEAQIGTKWQEYTLNCPFTGVPVEGYNLIITKSKNDNAICWIDTVRFEPQWKK